MILFQVRFAGLFGFLSYRLNVMDKNWFGDFGKFEKLFFYVNVHIDGFFVLLD